MDPRRSDPPLRADAVAQGENAYVDSTLELQRAARLPPDRLSASVPREIADRCFGKTHCMRGMRFSLANFLEIQPTSDGAHRQSRDNRCGDLRTRSALRHPITRVWASGNYPEAGVLINQKEPFAPFVFF